MALGVNDIHLEAIRREHLFEPNICLYKSILIWLDGQNPKPSWKALADVLRFKMLQSKLANEIACTHFSDDEQAEEDRYLKGACDSMQDILPLL